MIKKSINKVISLRRGTNFDLEYSKFNSLTDNIKLSEFQEKYLKKLLLYAYKNVIYYHRIFDEIGLINDGRVDLSKFNKIPILTKDIIRKNQEKLVSKGSNTRNWHYHDSGGSTGEPISIIHDDDIYPAWYTASEHYYYANMLNIDEFVSKKIIIWGLWSELIQGKKSLNTRIHNWLSNQKLLNCLEMTEDDLEHYLQIINSFKPDIIRGYSSALYELCRHADRKNLAVYTPKIVISAAETLLPEMREQIEAVFATKVYNFYGATEVGSIAGECKEGLMHIFSFYNNVEILDNKDQPVNNGEEGRVIITNLYNYLMPLIRYEIGDMALLGPKRCKCGNVLPTLENVTGRITDWFIKEDGTTISPMFFMFLFMPKYRKRFLKKFQIIQEDYKKIRILIVTENSKEIPQKDIDEKIKQMMGKDCKIIWEFVDEIPKTKSGKYIYIKSLVWRQK